jgi:hypothetical protein
MFHYIKKIYNNIYIYMNLNVLILILNKDELEDLGELISN